jgi:hypothetical protein
MKESTIQVFASRVQVGAANPIPRPGMPRRHPELHFGGQTLATAVKVSQ